MVVAHTQSIALLGINGAVVDVEADLSENLPAFFLIGLPDAALAEARDRVRTAAKNAGCPLPNRRLTVNLSPAALPKQGSGFDLAIALACLASSGLVPAESVASVVHFGELSLDGRLRPIPGVLPAVLASVRAGHSTVMVPEASKTEAELVPGARVIGVASLREAAIWHGGDYQPIDAEPIPLPLAVGESHAAPDHDLADIAGHADAVDALIVAAAGGHHMFLQGPPGAGKTMLATTLPGILPDLDSPAALEVASIRSLVGVESSGVLARRPPFESPHHTSTAVAMVGGGSRVILPGAAVRASHGVLFLDEAPEFAASALEVLRQPLESGDITIHRAHAVASFPAQFQLVLAANPCPCGKYGSRETECACPPLTRRRYLGRLSGPLLDRVDIRLWVPRISAAQLRVAASSGRVTSADARARVVRARHRAAERLSKTPWRVNAQMPGAWLRGASGLHPGAKATAVLDRALERGHITMRGYDRVLKLAWTVSDLDDAARPDADHIGRALYLRQGLPS